MPYLIYAPGTADEIVYELKFGKNTLGRAQDNTIVVIQENFSRYHAEINVTETGVTLTDLRSSNGTFVNHIRTSACELTDGDAIACGETILQFAEEFGSGSETPADAETSIVRRFSMKQVQVSLSDLLAPEPTGSSILRLRGQEMHQTAIDKLKLLLEVTHQFLAVGDRARLWERILDVLFAVAVADRAAILTVNRESQELECRAVKARSGLSTDEPFYSPKITATVREQGDAILTATAATGDPSERENSANRLPKIRGSICVPLTANAETLGVLYLENLALSNIYPEEDVKFLAAFANQVAIAVQCTQRQSMRPAQED